MKSINYITYALSAFFVVFMFACQAQDESQMDPQLYKKIYNDPLAVKSRAAQSTSADLILYGKVDVEALDKAIPYNQSPCESLKEDHSEIEGAREYLQSLCDFLTHSRELETKYPELAELDSDRRAKILIGEPKQLTEEEARALLQSRNTPDQ